MGSYIKNQDGTLTPISSLVVKTPINRIKSESSLTDSPIGHIISYMGNTAPDHYLICDGTEYIISEYKQLADHFAREFGAMNYFGGDGIDTFAVPDLTNRFTKGGIVDSIGTHEEAGLPNIEGFMRVHGIAGQSFDKDGSFTNSVYTTEVANQGFTTGSAWRSAPGIGNFQLFMDASLSSEIYGKSETVTPENLSVLYCIKYENTYFMKFTDYGYKTEELFTGKYWIDDKLIYRIVYSNVSISGSANEWITLPITVPSGTILIVNGNIISYDESDTIKTCVKNCTFGINNDNKLIIKSTDNFSSDIFNDIIIEYIKE